MLFAMPKMIHKILIFNCLFWLSAVATAQNLQFKHVPTMRDGLPLRLSGLGGLDAPQYSALDLNNDGKQDLLIYDRVGQIALPLINEGNAGEINYRFAPEFMGQFPQGTSNFMLAHDYNCDGIADLIHFYQPPTGGAGVRVMRGSYDSQNRIQFTAVSNALTYDFGGFSNQTIFIYNPDVPAFDDIDNDGDMDIIAFALDFTFARNVFYYKNMSQELGYGCDSLKFELFNQCFGQFSEASSNNTVIFSGTTDSCGGNQYWRNPRHLGSSLGLFDHNGDGHKDLFMGDVSVNTINMMTMSSIGDTLVVTHQDSTFPTYDTPVALLSFPTPYFFDLNNDGLTDLLVANSEQAYGEAATDSTTWLYLNNGTGTAANFALNTKAFLFDDMLDFGREAHPVFVDFDGDGLLDIVVGNSYNTRNNRSTKASLSLLRNVGTATAPAFEQINNDIANLSSLNIPCLYPTFGDLDGDGDLDLLVGGNSGTLIYAENRAGAGQPMSFAPAQNNFANIAVFGSFVAPQLYDIDGDGDLDIIAGENNGNLNFFENTGTATNYSFSSAPTSAQFGLFALNAAGSRRSVPLLYQNPQTQNTEMLLGHELGNIIKLGNIDGNINGKFDSLDTNVGQIYAGKFAAVATADIDGDSLLDIVVGNARGGLSFYTTADTSQTVHIIDWSADLDRRTMVYPNPTDGFTTVRFAASSRLNTRINVYTAFGFIMQSNFYPSNATSCQLDLRMLKEGIYIIEVWNNGRRTTYRVVLLPH
jgi:hypothetical protein